MSRVTNHVSIIAATANSRKGSMSNAASTHPSPVRRLAHHCQKPSHAMLSATKYTTMHFSPRGYWANSPAHTARHWSMVHVMLASLLPMLTVRLL